jgi:ABC-type Fe3+-hydroxamate transport system substrate-binding protein
VRVVSLVPSVTETLLAWGVVPVAVTSAIVGSMVYTLPPACVPVQIGNVIYQQCGSAWYQPQYVGTSVQYVVINPPR